MERKSYKELITIPNFIDRYYYLRNHEKVGEQSFGFKRWINQILYHDMNWRKIRREIIIRDLGHDLGMKDDIYEVSGMLIVHHINPVTVDELKCRSPSLTDPDNLITVSDSTHRAIHYSDESLLPLYIIEERFPNDTSPWKRKW